MAKVKKPQLFPSGKQLKTSKQDKPQSFKAKSKVAVKKEKVVSEVKVEVPKSKTFLSSLETTYFQDGVSALLQLIQKTGSHNQLLDDVEKPIILQINAIKIPKCRERAIRVELEHSLLENLTDEADVCLIVADLQNTNKKDYKKATEHYERILQEQGVKTKIKTIMTYHQLRNEYQDYEMKRKLMQAYEVFLVDGKIHGHTVHKTGSVFTNARKVPNVIRFNRPLAKQIESCVKKTQLRIHGNGDTYCVQVAHSKMSADQIVANIKSVLTVMKAQFPGGLENVRSLNIKTAKSMAIPIYLTLKHKAILRIPILKSLRPKKFHDVTGELSTYNSASVTVKPGGEVELHQIEEDLKEEYMHDPDDPTEDIPSEDETEKTEHDDDEEVKANPKKNSAKSTHKAKKHSANIKNELPKVQSTQNKIKRKNVNKVQVVHDPSSNIVSAKKTKRASTDIDNLRDESKKRKKSKKSNTVLGTK